MSFYPTGTFTRAPQPYYAKDWDKQRLRIQRKARRKWFVKVCWVVCVVTVGWFVAGR
jgi:hypothetical protein